MASATVSSTSISESSSQEPSQQPNDINPSVDQDTCNKHTDQLNHQESSASRAAIESDIPPSIRKSTVTIHPKHSSLLLVHEQQTESTQDLAKQLLQDDNFKRQHNLQAMTAICVTTTEQTKGRGTNGRQWLSKRGNTFVTIGIRSDLWMKQTKLPMTMLPLSMGLVMAEQIEALLFRLWDDSCGKVAVGTAHPVKATTMPGSSFSTDDSSVANDTASSTIIPKPTVNIKWPNDVLVNQKKIAGVLIEMDESRDWFLIGVGVNVKVAPPIDASGGNHGRPSTSIADYLCKVGSADLGNNQNDNGEPESSDASKERNKDSDTITDPEAIFGMIWEDRAQQLGVDIAHGLVEFLRSASDEGTTKEALVARWKTWIDWTVPLILRDGNNQTPVLPISVESDGRLLVRDTMTGREQLMVSDYFF